MSTANRVKDAEKVSKNCVIAAGMFKTLSNPLRLAILCTLFEGEKSVTEIEQACDGSQSQISQFLKRMEYEKMVEGQREGKCIYYKKKDKRLYKLFKTLHEIF